MVRIKKLLALLFLAVLVEGCGNSTDVISGLQSSSRSTVSTVVSALQGGTLTHPDTGHTVTLLPNALSADSQVQLTLVPSHFATPIKSDFQKLGTAMNINLGTAQLVGGLKVVLPSQFTAKGNRFVAVELPGGFVLALPTDFDATAGTFAATLSGKQFQSILAQTTSTAPSGSFTVGLVDAAQYEARPDHVPWPSYNLYLFQNGAFQKVLQQGQPVNSGSTLADPGTRPLMVVHGLGSNTPKFDPTVQSILGSASFTTVWGFEYDTLASLADSGPKLRQAYIAIENGGSHDWHHLAHSMGCLVSRQGMENGGSLPYNSNNVVFAAGPHTGSKIVNALQANTSIFKSFLYTLVMNDVMDFTNADGTPCKVSLTDPGFVDLAQGSAATAALNNGAAGKHPKETYRTLGGNDRGLKFDAVDFLVGTYLDDGFVDLVSANPGNLIGSVENATVPDSHTNIVTDTNNGLKTILEYLGRN